MKYRIPNIPDYNAIRPRAVLLVEAGGKRFYASLEDSAPGRALTDHLNAAPLTVEMRGVCEKEGTFPRDLPRDDRPSATQPGDILLTGGKIVICYDEATRECTRLARIGNVTKEKLLDAFGAGCALVTFSLEWSE